jgi:hypothetical protein
MDAANILTQLSEINNKLEILDKNIILFTEKTNAIYQAFISYFEVMGRLEETKTLASIKKAC